MRSIICVFFLLISTCVSVYAQATTVTKSTQTQKIGTQLYYVHTVKQEETLYSISRVYKVSLSDIQKANEGLQSDIKIDQIIYIPCFEEIIENPIVSESQTVVKDSVVRVEVSKEKSQQIVYNDSLAFYAHTVQPQQTLYFLSRLYSVSAEQIYASNPGASEVLSIGQILYIPCANCEILTKQDKSPKERKNSKDNEIIHLFDSVETVYQVALSYAVPPEILYIYNPSLLEGPLAGKKITVPVQKKFIRKNFIYYQIPKNANITNICQLHRITNEELLDYNPRAAIELKEGTFLRIPVTSDNVALAQENIKTYKDFQFHIVAAKETIYSITKKYDITEKELYKLNPSISKQELSIGTILKLPAFPQVECYVYSDTITRVKKTSLHMNVLAHCCDTNIDMQKIFTIALMLPFFLEKNNSFEETPAIINKRDEIYEPSLPFIEYYEGVLLGIDSLKKRGISIVLNAYEINRDTAQMLQLLTQINTQKTDLIIGPVFPEMFGLVADFATNNSIPLISPLASTDNMVDANPYAIQMNPPERLRYGRVANKLTQVQNNTIIIVYNSVVMEQQQVDECKRVFLEEYADSIAKYNIKYVEVLFPEHGMKAIESHMKTGKPNTIVFLSKNQAFITNVITQLYRHVKKYPIQVFSFVSWERYENIELDFLFDLHFHYTTSGFTNYETYEVSDFIAKYRELYKTEPTRFSFQGYDQLLYFVESLERFGPYILDCMPSFHKQGLYNSFKFIKETEHGGLINNAIDVIEFSHDKTLKVAP